MLTPHERPELCTQTVGSDHRIIDLKAEPLRLGDQFVAAHPIEPGKRRAHWTQRTAGHVHEAAAPLR
jgi:hypothetical protein